MRPTYCQIKREREGALVADPQFMKKDIRRGGPASWPSTRKREKIYIYIYKGGPASWPPQEDGEMPVQPLHNRK